MGKFAADDLANGQVRPFGRRAAEMIAIGMRILPAADRVLERPLPMPFDEAGACRQHPLHRVFGQRVGAQYVVQLIVKRVFGMRLRVVEEIAVEVDVVFRAPEPPGEAERVHRVNHQQRNPRRQRRGAALTDPCDHRGRAAISFRAMRSAGVEQHGLRVCRPEPCRIGEKPRTLRSCCVAVLIGRNPRVRRLRRLEEPSSRFRIGL